MGAGLEGAKDADRLLAVALVNPHPYIEDVAIDRAGIVVEQMPRRCLEDRGQLAEPLGGQAPVAGFQHRDLTGGCAYLLGKLLLAHFAELAPCLEVVRAVVLIHLDIMRQSVKAGYIANVIIWACIRLHSM